MKTISIAVTEELYNRIQEEVEKQQKIARKLGFSQQISMARIIRDALGPYFEIQEQNRAIS